MAKKQTRQTSRPAAAVKTANGTPVVTRSTPVIARSKTSVVTEFNPDYSHQIGDLKRIGMLAASFFVILIVLSFFIS
jgi:hypothetical protein